MKKGFQSLVKLTKNIKIQPNKIIEDVTKKTQNLKEKTQNVVNQKDQYIKATIQTLQQAKKKAQYAIQQKKIRQVSENLKEKLESKLSKAKQNVDQTLVDATKKANDLKQQIQEKASDYYKQSQKIIPKVSQTIITSAKYAQKQVKATMKKGLKESFNFVFWRAFLILGGIAFLYGLGTSLPKQIGKQLSKNQVNDTNNQIQTSRTLAK